MLTNGKQIPICFQGDDFIRFTINRHISKPEIITFINKANDEFQLTQKELICLGLIAQQTSLSAIQFSKELNLPDQPNAIRHWLGRLPSLDLIKTKGRTKGLEYFINPEFLKRANFKGKTNLKNIEDHRLEELIYKDLSIYSNSSINDLHQRIGSEISKRKIKSMLDKMEAGGSVLKSGTNRWTTYSLNK